MAEISPDSRTPLSLGQSDTGTATKEMSQIEKKLNEIEKNTGAKRQTQGPEFSVDIEYAFIAMGGHGRGTGFWVSYGSPPACSLAPARAVFFIRVTNASSMPTMVTSYELEFGKTPLTRLRTRPGHVFMITDKGGRSGPLGPRNLTFQFIQGPGLFSWVQFLDKNADFGHAVLLDLPLFDSELARNYIDPHRNIRGWAFFDYPDNWPPPTQLRMVITDELGKIGSYSATLKNGNPEGDVLPRIATARAIVDMSSCSVERGSP